MPAMAAKNYALSPAATDLGLSGGLGNQLEEQLSDEEKKRRKLLEQQRGTPGQYGDSTMGLASMDFFGTK